MDRAFDPNQPIVLIDADTGQRQLIWSELDSNASSSPAETDLIIRPGTNLDEGHRYIVALRNLKDASGDDDPGAARASALPRRHPRPDIPAIEKPPRPLRGDLRQAPARPGSPATTSTWPGTSPSPAPRNITERMLSIRDDGLAELGDTTPGDGTIQGTAPEFTITERRPTSRPPTGHGVREHPRGHRHLPGAVLPDDQRRAVPPGGQFNLGPDGLPQRNRATSTTARFTCNIPRSAVTDDGPGVFDVDHQVRPSMYGHGLFGDYTEVHTTNVRQLGNDQGVITCATDFIGMAEDDVGPRRSRRLPDLSKFQPLPDRLQQGFLDFIYLGRLLIHPDGFASDPAFQFSGHSVIDHGERLFYYGNSQGGIAGGALTAVEPDFTRSVLYVPGMNYSTLLTRSVDFEDYALILYPSYPDESERPLLLSMIQMMWDRGEPTATPTT